eukprot:scaffold4195_cov63-Phaeocystis_antarctica.AAC.1
MAQVESRITHLIKANPRATRARALVERRHRGGEKGGQHEQAHSERSDWRDACPKSRGEGTSSA